jgi:hypothetical protein
MPVSAWICGDPEPDCLGEGHAACDERSRYLGARARLRAAQGHDEGLEAEIDGGNLVPGHEYKF